jgi:thioredoxin-related protein
VPDEKAFLSIPAGADIFSGRQTSMKGVTMPARRMVLALAAAAVLAGCGAEVDDKEHKAWMSFNEGMELARKLRRPVVIDFYTSWCRWCKVMDRETFSNDRVASYLSEHFVCIRVDAENKTRKLEYGGRTYSPSGLARAFRVRGYPSIAYLDDEGDLLFVDPGFKKPDQFMVNLSYVKSRCWEKNVSLDDFRRRGGDCD